MGNVVMAERYAFISYFRENSEIVDRLAADLRSHNVNVWLDRNNIIPGQNWKYAIRKAIEGGAFFIACFSPNFRTSSKNMLLYQRLVGRKSV